MGLFAFEAQRREEAARKAAAEQKAAEERAAAEQKAAEEAAAMNRPVQEVIEALPEEAAAPKTKKKKD